MSAKVLNKVMKKQDPERLLDFEVPYFEAMTFRSNLGYRGAQRALPE